ncbi:hypothetical protein DFH94DRAFT_483094 [Russula ochroleuca]|uniref:Uncharacterized protein n=1 Tax=Russula ochroleuca TaxID=152965 RepID=A0A9P5JV91_9AGAM|nr:hypothetical protein DFH94DRAFT_483094 [Russula ochroleuca]
MVVIGGGIIGLEVGSSEAVLAPKSLPLSINWPVSLPCELRIHRLRRIWILRPEQRAYHRPKCWRDDRGGHHCPLVWCDIARMTAYPTLHRCPGHSGKQSCKHALVTRSTFREERKRKGVVLLLAAPASVVGYKYLLVVSSISVFHTVMITTRLPNSHPHFQVPFGCHLGQVYLTSHLRTQPQRKCNADARYVMYDTAQVGRLVEGSRQMATSRKSWDRLG